MIAPLNIKWGISTLGCHELDLPAICALAQQHGIHHLEIRSLADCLELPKYLDQTYPQDPAAVREILARHNQSIIALNSGFSLIKSATDQAPRDQLLGFARWAELLEIPFIRVFGGGTMDQPLTETDLTTAVANLNWFQRERQKNNWKTQIALETHDGFSSGQRCLQLQEAYGSRIDVIWDTHHTWKTGGESPQETWDQIAPMIQHIHIKDSVSIPSARHPYSYVLPGEGEFPVVETFDVLRDNHYSGVVSLEWERKWHPYLPELDTALKVLADSGWKSGAPQPVGN
jgi:sugar phosphate isomerase/epimerase